MSKKIFYNHSYEDITESISKICNCNANNINKYIESSKPFSNISISDIDLCKFFDGIGIEFSGKNELYDIIKFDSLVVSHLTSRINKPDESDIYYLFKVLTEPTDLSIFLASKRLIFKKSKNGLIAYYNNEIVDWDKFDSFDTPRIKVRLRDNNLYVDNCINGFLINDRFWEDSNVTHIRYYPEILGDICECLGQRKILNEWENIATPYALGFISEIKDIIFDEFSNCKTKKSKIYLFYKYVIFYLIQSYHGLWDCRNHNSAIRLHDYKSISKNDIFGYYIIEDDD